MGPKTTRSSTAIKDELSSSVKTEAKKTGRRVTTHNKKLEAAKRKVRGRGRPPGAKKSIPKEAGSGSGMEKPIQSIVYKATLI
jgi:hypothetical protein